MDDPALNSTSDLSRRRSRGYTLETGCPGCGGVVKLRRDYGTARCRFCGSLLRIELPQTVPAFVAQEKLSSLEVRPYLDRYLKQSNRPLSTFGLEIKGVYLPYWKVDGMLLKLRQEKDVKVYVEKYGYA